MNVLFVGGSNFVIKNGISSQISTCLKLHDAKIDNVYNISVGATGSMFGLENLIFFGKRNIDLVFVEYGINDLPAYGNDKVLWKVSYEGLIRKIREKYPSAHVVVLLLGRQPERFWKSQAQMHMSMKEISQNLGCLVLDIDAVVKNKCELLGSIDKFYMDDSHYLSPTVTQYISRFVVSEYLLSRNLGYFDSFVRKDDEFNATFDLSAVSGKVHCFENSRFKNSVSQLNVGETVELTVPGLPIGVSFVSTKGSSSLLVEVNGVKKIVNTLRRLQDSSKLEFIVKQIPFYKFSPEFNNMSGPQKIKLTPLNNDSRLWDESVVQKTYGMVPSSADKGEHVLISHVMTVSRI